MLSPLFSLILLLFSLCFRTRTTRRYFLMPTHSVAVLYKRSEGNTLPSFSSPGVATMDRCPRKCISHPQSLTLSFSCCHAYVIAKPINIIQSLRLPNFCSSHNRTLFVVHPRESIRTTSTCSLIRGVYCTMETDVKDKRLSFGSSLCYWKSSINLLVSVHHGDNPTYHCQPLPAQRSIRTKGHPEDQTFVVLTVVIDESPAQSLKNRMSDGAVTTSMFKKCYPSLGSIYPSFLSHGGRTTSKCGRRLL